MQLNITISEDASEIILRVAQHPEQLECGCRRSPDGSIDSDLMLGAIYHLSRILRREAASTVKPMLPMTIDAEGFLRY